MLACTKRTAVRGNGVGLDFADGKNNGSVGGHTYFSCEPSHGVLVKPARVTKADEAMPADGAR